MQDANISENESEEYKMLFAMFSSSCTAIQFFSENGEKQADRKQVIWRKISAQESGAESRSLEEGDSRPERSTPKSPSPRNRGGLWDPEVPEFHEVAHPKDKFSANCSQNCGDVYAWLTFSSNCEKSTSAYYRGFLVELFEEAVRFALSVWLSSPMTSTSPRAWFTLVVSFCKTALVGANKMSFDLKIGLLLPR